MIKKNWQKGTVVIITFLILAILLLLGSYFLSFTLTETRISKSQEAGTQTYYLAEAGINEAIWKLKNDPSWASDFVDLDNWTATFSRSLGEGSYEVTIQNSARGRGQIISTAALPLPEGKTTQRVVKTMVFKALGSPTRNNAIFTGGSSENIEIKFSRLRIYDGNLFSNHNLDIKLASTIELYDNITTTDTEGLALAVGNLNKSAASTITAEAICAKNECTEKCAACPPEDIGGLPVVDFFSDYPECNPPLNSFKCRAQAAQDALECQVLCNGASCVSQPDKCIYSASDFEDLLWEVGQGGTLTLNNEITYVTGDINLKGGRHLIVNGILVADDNIYIGERYSWTKGGQKDEGFSQITINRPTTESPSGLLTKRKIDFGPYCAFQPINITGVIYANDEVSMVSVPESFNILGGIIARKLSLTSLWQWLNITLDNDIILYGLGYLIDGEVVTLNPEFSPIITIDHWEESY